MKRHKLRILIISTFFPPLNSIASLRPYSWAKFWSEEGHDVTVLTTKKIVNPTIDLNLPTDNFEIIHASPSKFVERIKTKQNSNFQSSKDEKKIGKVQSFLSSLRKRTGIFSSCRFPDLTHFWIKHAMKAIEKHQPWDLVVSSAGPYTVHIVAEKLKKNGKAKKWIADFRDKWSDNHIFPGLFPFNALERRWEKKLMKSADAIVSVSHPYADSFRKKYGKDKVFVIENGFDPTDLQQIPPIPIFLNDNKFRIVHTGSVYLQNQHPEQLFTAIQQMSKETSTAALLNKLEVIFVGPNLEPINKLIAEYKVDPWVKVLGLVNREVALRMQRDAHAVLFFPWIDPNNDGVFSGKIFEYLYSRTPVMAIGTDAENYTSKFILDSKIGKTLTNTDQIVDYLKTHLEVIKKEKAAPLKELLNKYDRKSLAMKLLKFSEKI